MYRLMQSEENCNECMWFQVWERLYIYLSGHEEYDQIISTIKVLVFPPAYDLSLSEGNIKTPLHVILRLILATPSTIYRSITSRLYFV